MTTPLLLAGAKRLVAAQKPRSRGRSQGNFGLVTTGIILKGRTDTTTLTLPWRIAVTLAIGAGLALAIAGLWHTLAAEVGARTCLHTLDDIRDQLRQRAGLPSGAGRRLQTARTLVAALGLDPAQVHLGDLRPAAGALLNPEQHLHDNQRGKPAQADPARLRTQVGAGAARKQEPDTTAETRHHTIGNQTRLTSGSSGLGREVTVLLPATRPVFERQVRALSSDSIPFFG